MTWLSPVCPARTGFCSEKTCSFSRGPVICTQGVLGAWLFVMFRQIAGLCTCCKNSHWTCSGDVSRALLAASNLDASPASREMQAELETGNKLDISLFVTKVRASSWRRKLGSKDSKSAEINLVCELCMYFTCEAGSTQAQRVSVS